MHRLSIFQLFSYFLQKPKARSIQAHHGEEADSGPYLQLFFCFFVFFVFFLSFLSFFCLFVLFLCVPFLSIFLFTWDLFHERNSQNSTGKLKKTNICKFGQIFTHTHFAKMNIKHEITQNWFTEVQVSCGPLPSF